MAEVGAEVLVVAGAAVPAAGQEVEPVFVSQTGSAQIETAGEATPVCCLVESRLFNCSHIGVAMKISFLVLVLALVNSVAFAHGGGCLKDSPPGQCCHMDHKTGLVHCH